MAGSFEGDVPPWVYTVPAPKSVTLPPYPCTPSRPMVQPDPECPRGRVYELHEPEGDKEPGIYAHPDDIERAERDGWYMVFPR